MEYTQEQIEKLPKWAQSEIKLLKSYIQTLEQRIKEFNGDAETNTFLTEGLSKMPLQKNGCIEFQTGRDNQNKVYVYVRRDGMIDINTDSRLGQDVVILPRAANSFYLTFIER
jgi:hypothetical protein